MRKRGTAPLASWFLTLVFALLVWGPPRIRLTNADANLGALADDLSFQGAFSFDAANMAHLAVWATAGVIVYFAFLLHPQGYLRHLTRPPMLWYVLFGVAAVLSAAYSPSALYTLFFAAKILILLVFALLLARVAGPRRPLEVVFGVYAAQWVAIAVLFLLRPDLVGVSSPLFGYRLFGGVLPDYGASAATSGILALAVLLLRSDQLRGRTKVLLTTLYALSWVFVVLSQTRSTTLSSGLVLALLLALQPRPKLRLAAASIAVLTIAAVIVTGFDNDLQRFLTRGQTLDQLRTLSSRSIAFEHLYARWQEAPLLGYGYAAGSRDLMADFVRDTGMAMGSAHDALSRVLADLGALGTALLAASLLSTTAALRLLWMRTRERPAARLDIALIAALLVQQAVASVFGGGIAGGSAVYGVIIVALVLMIVGTRNRARYASLTPAGDVRRPTRWSPL